MTWINITNSRCCYLWDIYAWTIHNHGWMASFQRDLASFSMYFSFGFQPHYGIHDPAVAVCKHGRIQYICFNYSRRTQYIYTIHSLPLTNKCHPSPLSYLTYPDHGHLHILVTSSATRSAPLAMRLYYQSTTTPTTVHNGSDSEVI